MKKNLILSILTALILGYLSANYVLAQYNKENYDSDDIDIYFLEIDKKIDNINTIEVDNNLYIGITTDKDNAKRIKKIYKSKDIDLYIKTKKENNLNFITELEQYDILLKSAKDFDEINNILETILSTYEEGVLHK